MDHNKNGGVLINVVIAPTSLWQLSTAKLNAQNNGIQKIL